MVCTFSRSRGRQLIALEEEWKLRRGYRLLFPIFREELRRDWGLGGGDAFLIIVSGLHPDSRKSRGMDIADLHIANH